MDPYLEAYWGDVHHSLITYARDQIQPLLPPELCARADERVFVEMPEDGGRAIRPDVFVAETGRAIVGNARGEADVATAEPLVVHFEGDPITQGFIQILDVRSGGRVVTLIEFLSPTNKLPGSGRDLYLQKQREVRAARANLVEIDLTRTGDRSCVLPVECIPPSHRTTYQVVVQRGHRPLDFEVYRLPLARVLPAIAVPLREGERDVPLDLQALVELCYRNGRYDDLNYGVPPSPPLSREDSAWAEERIRESGRR